MRRVRGCLCSDRVLNSSVVLSAVLLTLVMIISLVYNFLGVGQVFTPSCPKPFGRTCNGRGTCTAGGLCVCNTLYSNTSCVDNQIPSYDLQNNTECSGHGYAYPFINVPSECAQSLVENQLVGGGWGTVACRTYVQQVRTVLQARNWVPTGIPEAFRIPICMCDPGYTGYDCSVKACPVGENLNICSGNGNTTVGIYRNATNSGLGCQCSRPMNWFQDQYRINFTPDMLFQITTKYNAYFNSTYCGTVSNYTFPGDPISYMNLYPVQGSYDCFCANNYRGPACEFGKCPSNIQTKAVCNGHGHPLYGEGLQANTTKRKTRQTKCDVLCQDDYTLCGNKCHPDQSPNVPLYNVGAFCDYPTSGSILKPIRCYDGTLVQIPGPAAHGCTNNYITGSIDVAQIDLLVRFWGCANITDALTFTDCFENTTEVEGIAGYVDPFGFNWNPNFTLTVDLGSPMAYLEFSTNATLVILSNWNGESYTFQNTSLIGQSFQYTFDNQGNWLPVENNVFVITNITTQYMICPMPFNFTIDELFPSNFSQVRLSDDDTALTYIFNAISMTVNVTSYHNTSYLLVQSTSGTQQPLWFFPTGILAPMDQCLSQPGACSWYISDDRMTIRNLESTLWVCFLDGVPVVSDIQCEVDVTGALADYLYSWETCLIGTTDFEINELSFTMTSLERNYTSRTSYPVNITFPIALTNYTVLDMVLLTLDRVNFPCACPPNTQTANRTTLNTFWYEDQSLRDVNTDTLQISDWVLCAEYSAGTRRLLRGQVAEINVEAETLVIYEPWLDIFLSCFVRDAREIDVSEVLSGWPDPIPIVQPYKCPDGQGSSVSSQLRVIDTSCNCTYNGIVTECSCSDLTMAKYGCSCYQNLGYCSCGFPATPSYEIELWNEVSALNFEGCYCLIFTPTAADVTNSSVTVTGTNMDYYRFTYGLNQVVNGLYLYFDTPCTGIQVNLTSGSFLFLNITERSSYTSVQDGCELWITSYLEQTLAYSELTVTSSVGFDIATLFFATPGYDLFASNVSLTFTASSNSANASLVNYLNGTEGWNSTDSEIPVWIQVEFPMNLFTSFSSVVFSRLGLQGVESRVFLQGYTNNSWFVIGSVSGYVAPRGWLPLTMMTNSSTSFSKYRLINPTGPMAIRQWKLFTDQQCTCPSQPNAHTFLRLTNTDGLDTIDDILEQIRTFNESINNACCSCTNNCTILVGGELYIDFANDGICEDAQFVANNLGLPANLVLFNETLVNATIVNATTGQTIIFPIIGWRDNINVVQYAGDESYILDDAGIQNFYETSFPLGYTSILANTNNDTDPFFETVLNIYFFDDTMQIYVSKPVPEQKLFYQNDTGLIVIQDFVYSYDYLVDRGLACATGSDCADCGPACRALPLMEGYTCILTAAQQNIANALLNTSISVFRTYYATNFSTLTSAWSFNYYNITVPRTVVQLSLDNCPLQTCPIENPYMCDDGRCVAFKSLCSVRYSCPGNGCVEIPGVTYQDAKFYRCACAPGYGGVACEFHKAIPATPYLEFGVSGAESIHCQGPCPLRIRPGIRLDRVLNFEELGTFNRRVTANSAPQSALDIDYHLLMPNCAPFGQVVRYKYIMPDPSGTLSITQRTIWTHCPPMRRGYHGEYILLNDDVAYRIPGTREPVWKVYINPITGAEETFPWNNDIISYNDFPFPCSNGDCAANEAECVRAVQLRPECNGRGTCLADGSCKCDPGYKTNLLTEAVAQDARYPYPVRNGIPDPTAWVLSDKWRTYALSQCTARDCATVNCDIPLGCFPGTPSLNFVDKLELCQPDTGRPNRCAATQLDCRAGIGITLPIKCSGNGIPRRKDFTGEWYCVCGRPASEDLTIGEASELPQLIDEGWGGPTCNEFFAATAPIYWSSWDFSKNGPYKSEVTGNDLPGKWLSGIAPVTPDPADRVIFETCCAGFERFEECPFTGANVLGKVVCVLSAECIPPCVPLQYRCSNHGKALGSGRCLCNINEDAGDGYTKDEEDFSVDNCYKYVKCPLSQVSGTPCNRQPACSVPKFWLHPLSYTPYFEQQWWICIGGIGLYNNITKLAGITTNADVFRNQLIQGLANIAADVQASINGIQSCVCIYPTDTPTSATGMLPGTSLQYDQSFKFPYKLPLFYGSFAVLTSGTYYSSGYASQVFNAGTSVDIQVLMDGNLTVSAIRIFGKPTTTAVPLLTFTDKETGEPICRLTAVPFENSTSELLNWALGSVGGALYCGPTYTCLDFRSVYPQEYFVYCVVTDSYSCVTWKEQTCLADVTNEYWPVGSLSEYQGCRRDQDRDPGGCVCCKLVELFAGTGSLTSGTMRISISGGPIRIGQFEAYGYRDTSLTMVTGLASKLNQLVGFNTACRDDRMLNEYLPADGNYFVPLNPSSTLQTTLNFEQARTQCVNMGGWLATTLNTIDNSDVELLRRTCNGLTNARGCYVGARETYFSSQVATRAELFNDPGGCFNSVSCVTKSCSACYETAWLLDRIPFTFSTYPTNPVGITQAPSPPSAANTSFTVPMFPGQISTKNALDSLPSSSPTIYGSGTIFYYPKTIRDCTVTIGQFRPGCTGGDKALYSCVLREQNYFFYTGDMDKYTRFYTTPVWRFDNQLLLDQNWDFIRAEPEFCALIFMVPYGADTKSCNDDSKYVNTGVGRAPYYALTPGYWTAGAGGTWDQYVFDGNGRIASMFYRYDVPVVAANTDFLQNSRSQVNNPVRGNLRCLRISPGINMFPPSEPQYEFSEYVFDASLTRKNTVGTYGFDWLPGVEQYNYLPAFVDITKYYTFKFNPYLEGIGSFIQNLVPATTPIYFRAIPGVGYTALVISDIYTVITGLQRCNACIKTLNPILQWMPQRFQTNTWVNVFSSPTADFGIQLQIKTSQGLSEYQPLSTLTNLAIRYHQVTFITNLNLVAQSQQRLNIYTAAQRVRWEFNNCGYVNSVGFKLSVCTNALNYICAYDRTKYTVLSGTQGDQCGSNVRSGGAPLPNSTCFQEFPLANATEYPLQHEILRQAQANTLDLYVDDYNLPTGTVNFGNTSVIWGFREAWLKWKNDFSNRPGQSSRGVTPQLDFCDMSLTQNFPFDCGIQRNPTTKVIENWCAVNPAFCNLNEAIPDAPPMKIAQIPPIYQASDITIAAADPTCGYPVTLASFFEVDKWGYQQDDLDVYVNVLQKTQEFVQLQIITYNPSWYNAGKTPYKYVFQANTTSNVAGRYRLDGCNSCVAPIMEIILYSLTQNYTLIEPILAVNVSMVKGVLTNFEVQFTVTEAETGVYFVNGNRFPIYTFRGIGYRFYNLAVASSVLLYNPIITNDETIAECTSRTLPDYVEPPSRILSSAPIRRCILTPEDQVLFPGVDIGQCGCDLSVGDVDCDCPKVLTPQGSLVCAGVGSAGTRALGPDGVYYTTRTGTGAGCFIYGPENLAECKTINVGTSVYTLLTPGAIWDAPAVTIDSSPISGASIFINPEPETTWQTVENVTELCLVNSARLPYYFTADELDQLVSVNQGAVNRKLILMGVGTPTDTQYPWEDVPGTYFINNLTGTLLGTEQSLVCADEPGACATINWNNKAYGLTANALTDGNLINTLTVASPGEITYPVTTSQTVWIYVFGTGSVDCTGGICDAGVLVTIATKYTCNCPLRVIQYTAGDYQEIQIFAEGDEGRSSFYVY